ncbi:hypothetical protein AB4562_01810 [Vibrio sp. 10N.222.54.A1]
MSEEITIHGGMDVEQAMFRLKARREDVYQAILDEGATRANQQLQSIVVAIDESEPVAAAVEKIKANTPDVAEALIREGLAQAAENKVKVSAEQAIDLADQVGLPELAARMLKSGMNTGEATRLANSALALKDVCAAADMRGSYSALVAHLHDPVRAIGLAIHEAQAEADENTSVESWVVGNDGKTVQAGMKPSDFFKRRKGGDPRE